MDNCLVAGLYGVAVDVGPHAAGEHHARQVISIEQLVTFNGTGGQNHVFTAYL